MYAIEKYNTKTHKRTTLYTQAYNEDLGSLISKSESMLFIQNENNIEPDDELRITYQDDDISDFIFWSSNAENNPASIKIWLDDIRPVPKENGPFLLCKSVNIAKKFISDIESANKTIALIDCDHDLGYYARYGGDGIKLLDWLLERDTLYPIKLHTQNPVGRNNMQRMLNRYWNNQEV